MSMLQKSLNRANDPYREGEPLEKRGSHKSICGGWPNSSAALDPVQKRPGFLLAGDLLVGGHWAAEQLGLVGGDARGPASA